MMHNNWKSFPHYLEMRINSLLYHAEPNGSKAFQLYKNCKNEQLWQHSFELFRVHLTDFYSQPQSERNKSYFDQFLDRPMNRQLYDEFQLSFRTAEIDPNLIHEIAEWAHETIQSNCYVSNCVHSTEVLEKTIERLTHPLQHEKDSNIEFSDFCKAWHSVLFKLFGRKYEKELEKIIIEITNSTGLQQITEKTDDRVETIYLTQTEIDWVQEIGKHLQNEEVIPKFPLSKGPDKDRLIQLQKACKLYNLILEKTEDTFDQHLVPLTNTINEHCRWLLSNCRR